MYNAEYEADRAILCTMLNMRLEPYYVQADYKAD